MAVPAVKPATYEDLFDLPPNVVGEIIAGRLIIHPRPAPKHARAQSGMGLELGWPFDRGKGGPGGWWILGEPEPHIAGDILVPDLASWRRDSLPKLPETAWFDLAPDWVCEVLSPGTARDDRVEKMPRYAAMGTGHAWLVDPDLRTLEVYELREGRWLLLETRANDDRVAPLPFEAVKWELSALWAD